MKEAKNIYEQFGGTYRNENGYRIPNLALPDGTEYPVSKYGRMHLDYIMKHRRGRYTSLLTECRLNEYLHEIDLQAHEMLDSTVSRLAHERGIDEDLKARDPLRWVGEMNNVKARVEELILTKIIYR